MPTTKPKPNTTNQTGEYRATGSAASPFGMTPEQMIAAFPGTGGEMDIEKEKGKAAKDLAKLNGQIQKDLQKMQQEAAMALAQQNAANQLAQQRDQQAYNKPFTEAELTGLYNGTKTLQSVMADRTYEILQRQQQAQESQFQQTFNQQSGQWENEFNASNQKFNAELNYKMQQDQSQSAQWEAEFGLQNRIQTGELDISQNRLQLDSRIAATDAELRRLESDRQNAIASGQLELAKEIQGRQTVVQEQKLALDQELGRAEASGFLASGALTEQARAARAREEEAKRAAMAGEGLKTAELSGVMGNGSLTEQARAARVAEAMRQAEISGVFTDPDTGQQMGVTEARRQFDVENQLRQAQIMGTDASGNLTDEAQRWRQQQAMDYAAMQAKLAQSPEDYFEAAALQRTGAAQNAMGFLQDINNQQNGTNAGFRTSMAQLPRTNSMQNIAGQTEGPSQSLAVAQNAAVTGAQGAYTASMNRPAEAVNGAVPTGQRLGAGVGNGLPPGADPYGGSMVQEYNAPQTGGTEMRGFAGAQQAMNNGSVSTGTGQLGMTGNAPDKAAQRLAGFAPTLQAGAHKLKAGALAAMSGTERGLFNSAARASGINPDDFEQQFNRSRLQTNFSANQI